MSLWRNFFVSGEKGKSPPVPRNEALLITIAGGIRSYIHRFVLGAIFILFIFILGAGEEFGEGERFDGGGGEYCRLSLAVCVWAEAMRSMSKKSLVTALSTTTATTPLQNTPAIFSRRRKKKSTFDTLEPRIVK